MTFLSVYDFEFNCLFTKKYKVSAILFGMRGKSFINDKGWIDMQTGGRSR